MRLLNRTLLSFSIYSVLVLLIITFAMYWVVNKIIIQDVDSTLFSQKKEIQSRLRKIKSDSATKLWEDLDGDVVIKLEPFAGRQKLDSIYSTNYYNSYSKRMEPYRALVSFATVDGTPYRLEIRVSLVESEDLVKALSAIQIIGLLALLSGLITINWWISSKIWRPFYRTLNELGRYEIEKAPSLDLIPSAIKEFAELHRVIGQLTERVHQVYIHQKEFTENAAHELQTPLAVFQSKLELMLQTNLSEHQAQILGSLLEANSRLIKLNKTLLLLSKIDSHQFVETDQVKVVELTSKLISVYREKANAKAIQIRTNVENSFTLLFNTSLLDILLSNLLSNAITHSPSASTVTISITNNNWEISNDGPPMPISINRIYDRFQKGPANSNSTGLGLAIAKKICDTSGLALQYSYQRNRHSFSISAR